MTPATLNDFPVERATVTIPTWGTWTIEASCDQPKGTALEGAVEVVLGRQSFKGTIVDGEVVQGRGRYRIVGGAGGWRKSIGEESYKAGLGVKLSTVVKDAAAACGEKLASFPERRIGTSFVRVGGCPARDVLDALEPENWYVDSQGVTHVGARDVSVFVTPYALVEGHPSRRFATIVCDDIRDLEPGVTLEGLTASSVRHELTPSGLRSHVWGATVSGADRLSLGDRLWDALARVVRSVAVRPAFFLGHYEYRVTSCSGGYLDVKPVSSSIGLPKIANLAARVGVPGALVDLSNGATVLVGFANGDPTRPYVHSYEGESFGGWLPPSTGLDATEVNLGAAAGRVLRSGDKLMIPGVQPGAGVTGIVVTLDPTVATLPGAPGVGRSKVSA